MVRKQQHEKREKPRAGREEAGPPARLLTARLRCCLYRSMNFRSWEVVMGKYVVAAVAAVSMMTAAVFAGGAWAMSGACSSGQIVKTTSYTFTLQIGPAQEMYSAAQVRTKHLKSGEVMLSGTMAAMNMATGTTRHLEVHICNSSGAVVTGAHPTIAVDDPSAKTMMMSVPVATMEGIGMGASDYHYGNNVELTAGHHITVTVTLKGQHAVFHTTVPKTGAMSMSG